MLGLNAAIEVARVGAAGKGLIKTSMSSELNKIAHEL